MQRALPFRQVTSATCQYLETASKPPENLFCREQFRSGRGELERERQAIEPAANLDHVFVHLEPGHQLPGALGEHRNRVLEWKR